MDKRDNAIPEVKGKIDGLELVASNVVMDDGSNVEEAITNLQTEVNGQRLRGIEVVNSLLSNL